MSAFLAGMTKEGLCCVWLTEIVFALCFAQEQVLLTWAVPYALLFIKRFSVGMHASSLAAWGGAVLCRERGRGE